MEAPGSHATVVVHEPPANSARLAVLQLINSTVGAGVLAFPYAFRQTGWAAGLACTIGIAAIEAFTMCVLARFAEQTKCRTYSALVGSMLGPASSFLMALVMFLYPFGSCIAYLVIVGDSFQPLLVAAGGTAWWTSRTAVISAIGCSCILPLCFPARLGALKAVSSICVQGLMVVVGAIVFRSTQIVLAPEYSWEPVRAFNPSLSFLNALPLIVFAFQCHTNIVSIWDELEERPALIFRQTSGSSPLSQPATAAAEPGKPQHLAGHRQRSEKLAGMTRVVLAGVSIVALFYSCVAVAGYLAFPLTARSNITLNFRQDDWLMQAARACIGIIQICAYPINHHPARGAIADLISQTTRQTVGESAAFFMVEPLAFFATTLGLALACNDLGVILKLVGGTCGTALIVLMPGALLVEHSLAKHRAARQVLQEQPQMQLAGPDLHEPLLTSDAPHTHGSASGSIAAEQELLQVAGQPFSVWGSELFWTGVALLAAGAFVALLAVATTLHPLPSN